MMEANAGPGEINLNCIHDPHKISYAWPTFTSASNGISPHVFSSERRSL